MDFIKIHDNKLKIALTASDLCHYGLSVERFDYNNVETKRALWQMLDEAKKSTGFDASDASLYVEVYPSRIGGCEIFVTRLDKKKPREVASRRAYLFAFDSIEDVIVVSAALTTAGYRDRSVLYRYDGRSYLELWFADTDEVPSTLDLVAEFGAIAREELKYCVENEGQLLVEDCIRHLGDMILHHS